VVQKIFMEQKKPIFKTSVSALAVCILTCLIYSQKGDKKKSSFQNTSGILLSVQNTHERFSGKDTSKYRYLEINNYPQPFQVFIGKNTGDFKPKLEKIDNLNIDDSITIYFEENNKTQMASVNNRTYFIDRKNEAIFIKGNAIKNWIYGIAIFCAAFIFFLFFLKTKGKIT
jgi:hypothetical protein